MQEEAQILIEVILRHAELLESTKIEPTELAEAPGQHLDTIVPLELINIIGVLHQELALTEVVQRVHGVPQDQLLQGHQLIEVQVVVPEVEVLIEALEAVPETINLIEVQHLEIVIIGLVVEVLVQEVAEAIEVLAVVPEVRAAVQEVLAALQDHHLVVGHLVVEVVAVEEINSQIF